MQQLAAEIAAVLYKVGRRTRVVGVGISNGQAWILCGSPLSVPSLLKCTGIDILAILAEVALPVEVIDVVAEGTVELSSEVEAFVLSIEVQTQHQVREWIADIGLVLLVNRTVMVEILIAEVTRLSVWLHSVSVLIGVGGHLGLILEDTVNDIAVELADQTAFFVADDVVAIVVTRVEIVAVEVDSFVAYRAKVQSDAILQAAHMVVPVDAKFPTGGLHTADILPHLSVPHRVAKDEQVLFLHEHVVALLGKPVSGDAQAIGQKGHVKSDVVVLNRLPLHVCVTN